jgi:hypothetical protein
MFDGAELAKAIAAHPGDIEAALAAFETAMFFAQRSGSRRRAPDPGALSR